MRCGTPGWFGLCLALCLPAAGQNPAGKSPVTLVLSAVEARPGDTVLAGVDLRTPPGWHSYWRNPGDSGMATRIHWTLPPGLTAGDIQWPLPGKLTEAGLTTYVYPGEVVLLIPLKLSAALAPGSVPIKARVDWLECQQECVMRNADATATLRVGPESKPSPQAGLLRSWQEKVPAFDPRFAARAWWQTQGAAEVRPVVIEWDAPTKPVTADFFPFAGDGFAVTNATELVPAPVGKARLRTVVYKQQGAWPRALRGVLIDQPTAGGQLQSRELRLELSTAPKVTTAQTPPANEANTTPPTGLAGRSLLLMLGFAFLGGLILNIMPCVLPVIALKILGFVTQSNAAPARIRKLGLVYAFGVLVSFLVLASVVIVVKGLGHAASWGIQLQNPQFVVAMMVLVTLVALNLFGVFEVTLAGRVMGAAGQVAAHEGTGGAFVNGVLATALATPCTAPALGTAMGFAFLQPPPIIVLMFLTVGLGLAAPYVVLSWQPGWLRFLPKPGAWMERFKVAMGFPMLATAIWLFTIATSFYGDASELWLGLFLVLLALAAWVWGQFVQRGSRGRGWAMALTVLLVAGAYRLVLEDEIHWRAPVSSAVAAETLRNGPDGIDWRPWSPTAVVAARAQGHPVLVDFTAKWCITCQVNRITSIDIPSVRRKLKAIHAVAFIENSLVKDATVVAQLERYGRAGVPLVLVYPRDPKASVIVLPQVLTPSRVLAALAQAAK